jgi:hypothetical protein
MMNNPIKHHSIPYIYPDNRGNVLALCGKRINSKDIDDENVDCKDCIEIQKHRNNNE